MRFCTTCGVSIGREAESCPSCNADVEPTQPPVSSEICHECARPVSADWAFCASCGATAHRPDGVVVTDLPSNVSPLVPEIIDTPDVELISRNRPLTVPTDAPLPPGHGARVASGGSDALVDPQAFGLPAPEPPPLTLERTEPPVSIFDPSILHTRMKEQSATALYKVETETEIVIDLDSAAAMDESTIAVQSEVSALEELHAPADDYETLGVVGFRSPGPPARIARIALFLVTGAALWTTLALRLLNSRLVAFDQSTGTAADVIAAQSFVDSWLRPLLLFAGLAALGALGWWTDRVYRNISAFGSPKITMADNIAQWSWFVPGLNLVVPPLLLDEAWRISGGASSGEVMWSHRQWNRWPWLGSVALTLATFSAIVAASTGSASVSRALSANRWLMAGALFIAIAGLSYGRAVGTITRSQLNRLPIVRNLDMSSEAPGRVSHE